MAKKFTSEIDDIFSGSATTAPAVEEPPKVELEKKKKKAKKGKVEEEIKKKGDTKEKEAKKEKSTSKPKVDTKLVVFEEPKLSTDTKAAVGSKRKAPPPDDGFADSRGTKSSRYTDDGYPIFDVKDLGIGNGGDTEQCPFDCDCCF